LTDIRTHVGAAVKALRARRRLTQEQLAERSGLSYKFVGEIERGDANPTILTLDRVAKALAVPISMLVAETQQQQPAEYQMSRHELVRVREALDSIADVTDRWTSVTYPPIKRRRRR